MHSIYIFLDENYISNVIINEYNIFLSSKLYIFKLHSLIYNTRYIDINVKLYILGTSYITYIINYIYIYIYTYIYIVLNMNSRIL